MSISIQTVIKKYFDNRPPSFLQSYLDKNISIHDIVDAVVFQKSTKLNNWSIAQFTAIYKGKYVI